MTLGTRRWIFD